MLASPPKRRKVSGFGPGAFDASQLNSPRNSLDRASFQSPTRASLARSHPRVLVRALSRTPTRSPQTSASRGSQGPDDTRTFGLRDRKALRPSQSSTTTPMAQETISPNRRSSGLQAFAVPPRRVSKRIVPSDLTFRSPEATQRPNEDPGLTDTPDGQLASELGIATAEAHTAGDLDQSLSHEGLDEPDLPPTPTQLGLERPPGRPTGLFSSSPSARGKLGRRRATDTLEHSPSKLGNINLEADVESQSFDLTKDRQQYTERALKKRKEKNRLSAEIQQLKGDIEEMEHCSRVLDEDVNNEKDLNKLASLLASESSFRVNTKKRGSSNAPISSILSTLLPFATKAPIKPEEVSLSTNPYAFKESAQTEPYLNTFAPLSLMTQSRAISTSGPGLLSEKHAFTLSAPAPFPPNLYSIPIVFEADPETQTLVSVSLSNSKESGSMVPEYLRCWINARLASPLTKLDVAGLCWGINRYWEASICRAQLWSTLERQHASLVSGDSPQDLENRTQGFEQLKLRHFLPHLGRSSLLFESKEKALRVFVSCKLTVNDWTSEPQLTPSINVTTSHGVPESKIEQDSKKLFQAILSEHQTSASQPSGEIGTDAILRASECVLSVVFGPKSGLKVENA